MYSAYYTYISADDLIAAGLNFGTGYDNRTNAFITELVKKNGELIITFIMPVLCYLTTDGKYVVGYPGKNYAQLYGPGGYFPSSNSTSSTSNTDPSKAYTLYDFGYTTQDYDEVVFTLSYCLIEA